MNDPKRILIAGGSGMIGSRLTEILQSNGYDVRHLNRRKAKGLVKSFLWDVEKQTIEPEAFEGVDAVINLAGTTVSKRWTAKRKKDIVDSRTKSAQLIFNELKKKPGVVKTYISASGSNYYGPGPESKAFVESDPPGNDFLSHVTTQWEKAADLMTTLGVRVVKFRIGVVLSKEGGALEPIRKAINSLVGSPMGTGDQMMSWIHIDDLCRLFAHAIKNDTTHGVYNAVSPEPVTNAKLIRTFASVLGKPILAPNVPSFVLKLMFGEMAGIILTGANLSSKKIGQTGFRHEFPTLQAALENIER
jgi:uncharacterized protein